MADLKEMRKQVDAIDEELMASIAKRIKLSNDIGAYKQDHSLNLEDEAREKELQEHRIALAKQHNLSNEFITKLFLLLVEETKRTT